MDGPSSFGDLLRQYRREAGLTQEELAERAGLSVRGISDLERGLKLRPRSETIALVADALNLGANERARLEAARRKPSSLVNQGSSVQRIAAEGSGVTIASREADNRSDLNRHNLPGDLSSFIGREPEMAQIENLLTASPSSSRLLTLTGAGGCGKTRLAIRVARNLADRFADGAWFVDLAPLADPSLIPATVASALGVREVPGRSSLVVLADWLRSRELLLLLDNCEHLIEACARLSDDLLQRCPKLRILATSREHLGISGERVWRVPSLTVPNPDDSDQIDRLLQSEATQLFVERARDVHPGFTVSPADAPLLGQICRRLDGIPFALELAAARVRVLTLAQIAARIDDRFRLLTDGSRTALPRQQTLRALINWSYDLLSEPERALLRRLSVFAGGWTLEAAEAVGADKTIASADVLNLLSALVDKSLVVAEGDGQHQRYRLLETIRQYAGEKLLEAGEVGHVRDRHVDWFMGLGARAEGELDGTGQEEWLGRLEAEHDNLRAALAWSLESDPAMGLRLAVSVALFWDRRVHLVEGRRWLKAFLERTRAVDSPEDSRVRASALLRAGMMASDRRDREAAWPLLDESLTLFRTLGDQRGVASALNSQGIELLRSGASAEQIQAMFEESLGLWRALGDQGGVADTLGNLSLLAARERDDASARRLMDEALALFREVGHSFWIAFTLVVRGWFAWGRDDRSQARRDLEEGLEITRRLGSKDTIGLALMGLGCLALEEGERGRARAFLEESARVHGESGTLRAFYQGLACLGHRAVDQGRHATGVRLLAAVEARYPDYAMIASLQPLAHPVERAKAIAAAREALGEEAFAAAWAEGQAMTPEQAIAEALRDERAMSELPTGTVTFLLTDVQGSTRLWEQFPDAMRAAMARHDAIVEENVERQGGVLVRPRGEGDSRFAVFALTSNAVVAAVALQVALQAEPWPTPQPLYVRIAVHTGEADLHEGDYYGAAVNRCARLRAIAHGGQVLISQATYEIVRDALPTGVGVQDLGEQRLADLIRPERVYQLRGHGLPTEFPPLRSLDRFPHNFPVQLTSFIGREAELADLAPALATTRLLTLTGTGGCGKTRLALQVAAVAIAGYPDGVWLVELAPLSDPTLVAQAVAAAVGVREEQGQPLLATLLAALRSRRLLLVLDNCEHLLDACARLADTLLRGCPQLRILATSREALGIGGEVTRRVPSLSVPLSDLPTSIERLSQYEAVQLFVERALAVQPAFAVTNQNGPAVAQLCRRLDGIPLAIELAAARVRVLTVEQIASRLGDRFRLLTGGSRTALRRQQTLAAAIDWSHDLLLAPERMLFRRLAVFVGGWSLEAAEGVCGDDKPDEVLDLLTSLVDKSLVVAEGQSADTRYHFLETIRQYSGEKLLAAGEAEAMRDRYLAWYLGLAEQAKPELVGREQVTWLDRLERERDNLRAALEWALEHGPVELGLRLAGAVWRLWYVRDNLAEGRDLLLRVLAAPGAAEPTRARAEVLDGACEIALAYQSDDPALPRMGEECLAIYRSLGDRGRAAWALCHLAHEATNTGDGMRAEGLAAEALAQAREADVPWVVGQALVALGGAEQFRGDYPIARRHLEESLSAFRSLGDWDSICWGLFGVGACAYQQHDYIAARTYLREALTIARDLRSKTHMSRALWLLGIVARREGDSAQSRALLEESLTLAREVGSRYWTGAALLDLGWLAREVGDAGRAESLVKESLVVLRDIGTQSRLAIAVGLQGVLAVSRDAHGRGARLLGAVARQHWPSWLPPDDRHAFEESLSSARAALGERDFAAAYAEGQAMTLEQAVVYALEEDGR